MIGPVQLIMIGFTQPQMTHEMRARVSELASAPAVRIIDVLCVHKNRDGSMEAEPVADLLPENDHEPGRIIDTLLTKAEAALSLNQQPWTGRGFLFRGDLLPDFRRSVREGHGVLALLLEHQWAVGLRDTATQEGDYPLADGWMGRDALKTVQLIPQDA
jgi:hypothetical protein